MKQHVLKWLCISTLAMSSHFTVKAGSNSEAITNNYAGTVSETKARQIRSIDKWRQFRVGFENASWEGNPYGLQFKAVFESPSDRSLTQFGFYAGGNTWKIYFMPDETGVWSYTTISPDADLDGHTGEFICKSSDLPGALVGAGENGNRWKYADAGYVMPLIWGVGAYKKGIGHFRAHNPDDPNVRAAINKASDIGAILLNTGAIVLAKRDWAKAWPNDAMPYVNGKEGIIFNPVFWDNLNATMDYARDRGMGFYFMLYTDDALKPDNLGIAPDSKSERRLFRYVTARLAPYPVVLWDSGIDITEYRNHAWINRFTDWFRRNDPWKHPVSSRHGGGSGSAVAENQTYDSVGGAFMPKRDELLKHLRKTVPTAHTDHWRVFISRGDWTNRKIRNAVWYCGLSGGQAPFPDYSQGAFDRRVMDKGAIMIEHATHFFHDMTVYGFGNLYPADSMILSGENAVAARNADMEFVVYDKDGGLLELDLTGFPGNLIARWYNPRTGEFSMNSDTKGGGVKAFDSPGNTADWVLHGFSADSGAAK
ncbi:MAG: DUF5060 domain-containing protein [Verrucomicrobia bacterium]|nr:DUF5060 domain-containing protein [Verrucomicrobiota bacterium]